MAQRAKQARLVHITTVPQTLGFLRGQVAFMRARGFDVYAISSPGEGLRRFGEQEAVAIDAVDMPRLITPLRDARALARLSRILRRIRPAIVHAHTPKGGLVGMLAAWLARAPVRIYHVHGLPLVTATGRRRTLLMATERVSCRLADQVLCVSSSLRDLVVAEGLCSPAKIEVLHRGSVNGVDALGRFDPNQQGATARSRVRARNSIPAEALVLGFVGRVVRDKGIIELGKAWQELRARYPALHLLIVGPFEPQDPIPADVEGILRHDLRVHLAGLVAAEHMPGLYEAMDLLALPSYREGLPYALLEAAAMQLPVVATSIPGCADAVVDGVTGTLVPPYDPEALAAAVKRYLDHPDLRRQHGGAGRERVLRDFRPEDVWEAAYQQYLRLLNEKGLRLPRDERVTAARRRSCDSL